MALIKCKECGNEISKKAKACPQCGAERKKTSAGTMLLAIFIGAFFIVIIMDGGKTDPLEKIRFNAKMACEKSVRNSLKSPASASFAVVAPMNCDESSCYTESYVDSDNAFGATLRSNFSCLINIVDKNDPSTWEVKIAAE